MNAEPVSMQPVPTITKEQLREMFPDPKTDIFDPNIVWTDLSCGWRADDDPL